MDGKFQGGGASFVGAAEAYARAFGQDFAEFLDELSERVTALRVGRESTA